MSLNGLDAPNITEAYEAVTPESGGWFLLKYISRDEVDILGNGSGGLPETRSAFEKYDEKSPLYGMVLYRRKKVLIKYIPDGTSRLLQARVAVHLQGVIEKFAHDALLPISSPAELQEGAISSVVSALKTSGSVKSADSSKSHRRLTGIQEAADEVPGSARVKSEDQREASLAQTEKPKSSEASPNVVKEGEEQPSRQKDSQTGPREAPRPTAAPTDPPNITSKSNEPKHHHPVSTQNSTQIDDWINNDRRQSSQSLRPSISDVNSAYRFKPKTKVGPRPSIEQTPAVTSSSGARPTSSLPAGIQMPQRQPKPVLERPRTQGTASKPFFNSSALPPPMPPAPSISGASYLDRPVSRAGSALTVPAYTHYPESLISEADQSSGVTPEKQRLMKALQKRKKAKLAKAAEAAAAAANPPVEEGLKPSVHEAVKMTTEEASKPAVEETSKPHVEPAELLTGDGPKSVPEEHIRGTIDNGNEPSSEKIEVAPETVNPMIEERKPTSDEAKVAQEQNKQVTEEVQPAVTILYSSENGDETPRAKARNSAVSTLGEGNDLSLSDEVERNGNGSPVSKSRKSSVIGATTTNGDTPKTSVHHEVETTKQGPIDAPELASANGVDTKTNDDAPSEKPSFAKLTVDSLAANATAAENVAALSPSSDVEGAREGDDVAGKMAQKRRGMITPIKTGDLSEATSLSGDSFLEELQSATVEEATPMYVSKSPATPFLPISPRSRSSGRSSDGTKARTPSGAVEEDVPPMPSTSTSPTSGKANRSSSFGSLSRFMPTRSTSGHMDQLRETQSKTGSPNGLSAGPSSSSLASRRDSPADSTSSRKVMSSLVSQRIQALQGKFSSSSSPTSTPAPVVTRSMVRERQSSLNSPPASAGTDTRSGSRPSSPAIFPNSTPSLSGGTSILRRFRPSREPSFESKQDALSVTATIVRDDSNRVPEAPANAAEPQPMNLHVSPLTVQHNRSGSLFTKTPRKKDKASSRSKSKSSSNSSVSSPPRDSGPTSPARRESSKRDSISSWRSGSSRKDSAETVRPLSAASAERAGSPDGGSSTSAGSGDKKDAKKRSLLKRMSNITFARRSIAQTMNPPLNDQPILEHQESEAAAATAGGWTGPVQIGDVNAQFPDTLLWKRRHLEVDAQGYLVLAPSLLDKSSRIGPKKFHISEFRLPYTPEPDREELPNSVLLDFLDSSTLQCACETGRDQAHLLQVLQSAHRAFVAA